MSKLSSYMAQALTEEGHLTWQQNRAYWRERARVNREAGIKMDEAYEKELERIYQETLDECTKEIEAFYAKYAEAEGISMAEARKAVSKADIEALARKAKRYVEERDFSDRANEEMRLYNATMKINRLEMLKSKIGLELVAMSDKLDKATEEHLINQALEEYEQQAGILGRTVKGNLKRHAKVLVNADFRNATFSERIWSHQAVLKVKLDSLLQQNMISGKGIAPLTRELKNTFGVSKYEAERLVRTETKRVRSEATLESYKENGVDYFEYLDFGAGSCEICRALNGKHFKVEDFLVGENAPPMHPNCRCSTAPWVDEAEYNSWLDGYREHGLDFEDWRSLIKQAKKDWLDTGATENQWNALNSRSKLFYGHTMEMMRRENKKGFASNKFAENDAVYALGTLDKELYSVIHKDIDKDQVIITKKQVGHIQERHPEVKDLVLAYMQDAIKDPDCILRDDDKSGLILKEIGDDKHSMVLVLRVHIGDDKPEYVNSVISSWIIRTKRIENMKEKKEVLYSK